MEAKECRLCNALHSRQSLNGSTASLNPALLLGTDSIGSHPVCCRAKNGVSKTEYNCIRKQILFLGSKSGRDSEKMKEVELTGVQTPSGDMSFKEARLIIECKLTALITANPNDFYTQEVKDAINEAYKEANVYRKLVFGEITRVWVKKSEQILGRKRP
jgi:hypothetical protein